MRKTGQIPYTLYDFKSIQFNPKYQIRKLSKQEGEFVKLKAIGHLVDTVDLPKAEDKNESPYLVTQVFSNGTVRLQRGSINERLNIRRLTPYFEEK